MNSSLPRNGRVVIIDDDNKEGIPLIKALSKNGIPTTYFTGELNELPDTPLEDVRIVFLDIVLGIYFQSEKDKVSTIIGVLKKIVSEKNGPYILIIWSKHIELVESVKKELTKNPPMITLNLEKDEFKRKGFNLKKIEDKLQTEFEKAGIFQLFLLWENLVNRSTSQIVKEFFSLYSNDDRWSENLSNVIYELAGAYGGKQLNQKDIKDIIQNGLLTFNGTFMDTLENAIREFEPGDIKINFDSAQSISDEIRAKINSKLLLQELPSNDAVYPGNIYEIDNSSFFKIDITELTNLKSNKNKEIDDILEQVKYVLLEVSPTCDFAQNKQKRYRILPGVMWPENHCKKIKKCEYIYTSPLLYLESNPSIFKLVFDLRHFTSSDLDSRDLKDKKFIFRMKHELLVDIQSHLAKHISRPGVIYLESK